MKRILILFFCLWGLASPLAAQETTEPTPPPAPTYPGVAEVIPRGSELAELWAQEEAKIASLKDTSVIEGQIKKAKEQQEEILKQISELGDPAEWSFYRLQEFEDRFEEQKKSLKKVLDTLSERLAGLDKIREDWSFKKDFWLSWETSLKESKIEFPREDFRRSKALIERGMDSAAKASGPLVALQKELTALQGQNLEELSRIEAILKARRGKPFKKNAHSFASREFYRQFDAELWVTIKRGIDEALVFRKVFWKEQGWIFALQVLVALVLAIFILRSRPKAEVAKEWQFILQHPWATGIFVSMFFFRGFYSNLPALGNLSQMTIILFSGSILVSGLTPNPRRKFMVYLLASLLVLSLGLKVISFPQPLARVYLALLSLSGIPLLLSLASLDRRAREGKADTFTVALRLGAGVLLASFLAQCGGFTTLAFRLIESSMGTIFLGLFAAMAIRLGQGGIEYLLKQETFRRYNFFFLVWQGVGHPAKGTLQSGCAGIRGPLPVGDLGCF